VSASQDEAVRHEKNGRFSRFCISRRHSLAHWTWRGSCFSASLFLLHGDAAADVPLFSFTKMSSFSSRSWAHEVIRKRNIEGVLFTSGDSGVLVWSHFGKCLGGGRIETKRCHVCFCSTSKLMLGMGISIWELRGVGRIFGLVPLLQMKGKRGFFLWSDSSFIVSFRGCLYICPRFVFFTYFSLSFLRSEFLSGTVYI